MPSRFARSSGRRAANASSPSELGAKGTGWRHAPSFAVSQGRSFRPTKRLPARRAAVGRDPLQAQYREPRSSAASMCFSARGAWARRRPGAHRPGGRTRAADRPAAPSRLPGRGAYGELYRKDPLLGVEAAHLGARLIALDLLGLGISVDCLPVLDIPLAGTTKAIGDRTLGTTVNSVSTLGGAQIDGLMSGGLLPVVKHMPGHGRAVVDSHTDLPRVEAPFPSWKRRISHRFGCFAEGSARHDGACRLHRHRRRGAGHDVRFVIINHIRGRIGFNGALMTDDISMGALTGSLRSRAEAALAAGCDLVLHCNGAIEEMMEIAAAVAASCGRSPRRAPRRLSRSVVRPRSRPSGGAKRASTI